LLYRIPAVPPVNEVTRVGSFTIRAINTTRTKYRASQHKIVAIPHWTGTARPIFVVTPARPRAVPNSMKFRPHGGKRVVWPQALRVNSLELEPEPRRRPPAPR
jgi:hypothetical protein